MSRGRGAHPLLYFPFLPSSVKCVAVVVEMNMASAQATLASCCCVDAGGSRSMKEGMPDRLRDALARREDGLLPVAVDMPKRSVCKKEECHRG